MNPFHWALNLHYWWYQIGAWNTDAPKHCAQQFWKTWRFRGWGNDCKCMTYHDNTALCLTPQAESPSTVHKQCVKSRSKEEDTFTYSCPIVASCTFSTFFTYATLQKTPRKSQLWHWMLCRSYQVIPAALRDRSCCSGGQNKHTYPITLRARCSSNPSLSRHALKAWWSWISRCPTRAWASLEQKTSCCLFIWEASLSPGCRTCCACVEVSGVQF